MYLLDTNVLSELRKQAGRRSDPRVTAWSKTVPVDLLFLSVVTIHEVEYGIRRVERNDRAKAAVLRVWLTSLVFPLFRDRILPVDLKVAMKSAELHAIQTRNWQDGLIVATAFVHDLVVVTRNVGHFASTEVSLLNPWEA